MAVLHYLDTSAAVPAFVRERASERVQAWLGRQPAGGVAISPWVIAEFSSALALKVRTAELSQDIFASAFAEWRRFTAAVRLIEIVGRHFEQASQFCQRHELALRAGDALHLAIASAAGCTLVTLDEPMAKAALELGVPVATI